MKHHPAALERLIAALEADDMPRVADEWARIGARVVTRYRTHRALHVPVSLPAPIRERVQ